jgi:uncharacterized protein (TIGR02391 family)
MSSLSVSDKTILESILGMEGGYVLDLSNSRFADLFMDAGIEIFHDEFAGSGPSKASRLRTFWQVGADSDVSRSLQTLAEYVKARHTVGHLAEISSRQLDIVREIATRLDIMHRETSPSMLTTSAALEANTIALEIHPDIYRHISQYLRNSDYYHAVEESYKLVREQLRERTGVEKASEVFTNSGQSDKYYGSLFGRAKPASDAEADFFRGVAYLNLCVQHLRNEKAHTPAGPVEANLALHYISLASLAYDLITRYVSDELVQEIESLLWERRRSYSNNGAFYRELNDGRCVESIALPSSFGSSAVRRFLKEKWLTEADFARSYDHSNMCLMRLELVIEELGKGEIAQLLTRPRTDNYGNDQDAGMFEFLSFVESRHAAKLPREGAAELAVYRAREE